MLVRVLSELLGPAEYGRLALAMTVGTLISQVVMSFNAGIGRYFSVASEERNLSGFRSGINRLFGGAGIVVAALTIVGIIGLKLFGQCSWLWILVFTAMFSYLSGCGSCLNSIQTAARQRAAVALHSGFESWLKIGLVFLVTYLFGGYCEPVIVGYALAALVVGLSQFYWVNKLMFGEALDRSSFWEKRILSFSWPFSIWGAFYWMQSSSDRWALERFSTTAEVGKYAVLYQLGYTPISMALGLAMTFLVPILYQRYDVSGATEDRRSVHNLSWGTTYFAIGCTLLGFLITTFCHQLIFHLFAAESFRGISFLLPWMILAGGLFSAGQILSLKLMAEMRTGQLLVVKVFTALLGVGANVIGAWLFGIPGVVAGMIVFSLGFLIWTILLAAKPRDTL